MVNQITSKPDLEFLRYLVNGSPDGLAPSEQSQIGKNLLARVERFEVAYPPGPQAIPSNSKFSHGRVYFCAHCNQTIALCAGEDRCPACKVASVWFL